MTVEITVILKDSERTYKQKFLAYDSITLKLDDPFLIDFIKEAQANFQGDPEDIIISAKMVFR